MIIYCLNNATADIDPGFRQRPSEDIERKGQRQV